MHFGHHRHNNKRQADFHSRETDLINNMKVDMDARALRSSGRTAHML
jgi:hypothetical protein